MEQQQPPRAGRGLAAIVAADVAGYSRPMGLDEVGKAHAPRTPQGTDALVEKHGGDGVLLELAGYRAVLLKYPPCEFGS
jgi:hypothetical protein